jgi:cellulose synthase/poly-beta-1,6-N-acetylglucosamine synthase-like glycosyltransferase
MIAYALLIEFYHRAWNRIEEPGPDYSSSTTTVSVIVSLRNESANIANLVQSLNTQQYHRSLTEVILIDDHSTDDTWKLIQQAETGSVRGNDQSSRGQGTGANIDDGVGIGGEYYIRAIRLDAMDVGAGGSFKKFAITKGVSLARGELIVTTDADCVFPATWLSSLVDTYNKTNAQFIAAPVKLTGGPSLLFIFQTLDFLTLQGITGASVSRNLHTMCNGANLAYSRAAFGEVRGFEGIDHIPSGDDMLLMYKIYRKHPARVIYSKSREAIVTTAAVSSWKDFFHQRIRWASKAMYYEDKRVFWVLLLVYLVNTCFLISGLAAFAKTNYFIFFLLMLLAKILIEFPFVNSVAMFFGQQKLMKYFPVMQPLHILYTLIAGWLGRFGSYEWKGRKINTHVKNIQ